MKSIRIAAGAGYAGDRIEPALDSICRGNADYLIFECLAERTIALAQKEKLADPAKGYNPLLEYRMQKVLPLLHEHPVKIITNMGAANPLAAAEKVRQMAKQEGLHLQVATVLGDDVLDRLNDYGDLPLMETGAPLRTLADSVVSANAYLGAKGISAALAAGADIVITGRVADPCLVSGPLMAEFQKSYDDADFLGKTIVAGHLLECAGQVTGGYFADPGEKDVPELWNLGFPILTFSENGDLLLEKLPGTGGLLNEATVKEQLLYEIQNPAEYLTPDVVADFTGITVQQQGEKVLVRGATGRPKTGLLKTSVGYRDGYIGEGEISYGGHNCTRRAQLAETVLRHRFTLLGLALREVRFDLLGVNSLYGPAAGVFAPPQLAEVRLRVAARTADEETATAIGREVEALYVNGPAGGGGARSRVTSVVSVASILLPQQEVQVILHGLKGEPYEIV